MHLKDFIPLSLRNRLRPAVQRLRSCRQTAVRQVVDSAWWPKPAEWRHLREQLEHINDPGELYIIASREFGILQIENEILPFLEYIRSQQPKIVGEIGLKHGGNTFLFTRLFPDAVHFIGLDLVLHNIGKARFLARSYQRLDVIEGSSYAPVTITKVRQLLGKEQFDFLFIDGDHEYAGVKADFEGYFDLVRSGGLIAFHDIVPDEFARTGVKNPNSLCYGGGVHLLWKELRDKYPHREFVDSWDQSGFGIGVLTKP